MKHESIRNEALARKVIRILGHGSSTEMSQMEAYSILMDQANRGVNIAMAALGLVYVTGRRSAAHIKKGVELLSALA